ncbi:Serine--tRNA ligase, mitochondrial [Linderina macrospora]|uniref:Serine--tRNA ligase, mitochondrial n=1 Tax=Linderina macrospora TaxID=4868 RepID=A0ACC1J8B3_9FUNG|nr:Serine--tRNA ligase, mitochondrial [Linderina macrospora]
MALCRAQARLCLSAQLRQSLAVKQLKRTLIQPSFNYKYIRDNANTLLENARQRNVHDAQPHRVGTLYDEFRDVTSQINERRSELNALSKQLAQQAKNQKLSANAEEYKAMTADLRDQAKSCKALVQELERKVSGIEAQLIHEAAKIPNTTHPDTPVGDESKARTVKIEGLLHTADRIPSELGDLSRLSSEEFRDHYDLIRDLDIVDMQAGAKVAGSRFHYWKGAGALLELALVQYAMTRASAAGFIPHITPDVARSSIVDACGFRPRSNAEDQRLDKALGGDAKVNSSKQMSGEASQIYRAVPVAEESRNEDGNAADPLCLVATAEIPLVAMKQKQILDGSKLPYAMAGLSHCFRAEAGARGRDTRGIYRLHQFTKVELVSLALPEQSQSELERLVDFQTSLYKDLGLTFRILQMPTHELGASAFQKFDIEAWMPGRRAWGEISSASNCTDYQARRLGIRARVPGSDGGAPVFVHTLNATAIAVPRLAVALLESFQRPGGEVVVPQVLRPWMMGMDVLRRPASD